jgi:hypothetical protein
MPLPGYGIDDFPHLIFGEVALLLLRNFWKDEVPIPPAAFSENEFEHPNDVANGLRSEFCAVEIAIREERLSSNPRALR